MNTSATTIDRDSALSVVSVIIMMVALAAAYIAGLFPDVMEVDAAQYASISREMGENGSYLEVLHRNKNYLDKPPLLFWLSSLTIQAFGNTPWAYKLPSFLFTVLGLWSVYRFTLIYYARKTAWFAFLILATSQAWFLFNNDVRTDTMLAGSVIFSVWQIARYLEYRNVWGLILGGLGVAAAMLAKGPIGLMAPALAVGSHIFFTRRWKTFFRPGWLLLILIAGVLLIPMCYGLYKQYGMEGIEFFFWKQSFGRITGENEWRNDAGYFFFLHTFPWAFMPWSLLAVPALISGLVCLVKNKFKIGKSQPETISLFGFLLPFIALSFSHYKLPHYIFVTFPFAAVFCAKFLYDALEKHKKRAWAWGTLSPAVIVLPVISGLACVYVFSHLTAWACIALGGLLFTAFVLFFSRKSLPLEKLVWVVAMGCCWANVAINSLFYNTLLTYQPGKAAAEWLYKNGNPETMAMYYISDHPIEFHLGKILPVIIAGDIPAFQKKHPNKKIYIYADDFGKADMEKYGFPPKVLATFPRHHPALLTPLFLNPETRPQSLENRYWLTLE